MPVPVSVMPVDPSNLVKGAWMAQECHQLQDEFDELAQKMAGRDLAEFHLASRRLGERRFGFLTDNRICHGLLQNNSWQNAWQTFFCEQRLRPQLAIARDRHPQIFDKGTKLLKAPGLTKSFFNHPVVPTLLHGGA